MGFLDQLKDIGFGNTGPYGRMKSGATNYAEYSKERRGIESERGVSQALALAAKNGQMIPFRTQAEIAEKWGVPLNSVIQRAKIINDDIDSTTMKKQLQSMSTLYMNEKKKNPSWVPTEKDLIRFANEVGVTNMKVLGIAKDYIVQLRDENKFIATRPGERITKLTTSIGGNVSHDTIVENPAIQEKDEEWKQLPTQKIGDIRIERQRNKRTGKVETKVYNVAGKSQDSQEKNQIESDITSLANTITRLKSGENIERDILATPEAKEQLLKAENQLETMINYYNKKFGAGSSERVGFGGKKDETTKTTKKVLTKEIASDFMVKAGMNEAKTADEIDAARQRAREMARKEGYEL